MTKLTGRFGFMYSPAVAQFRDNVLLYGFSLLVSFPVVFLGVALKSQLNSASLLLLFLLPVLLSTWYGNLNTGLISLLILSFGFIKLFPPDGGSSLSLLLFMAVSVLISFVLDKARKTDEVSAYKKRQYEYINLLLKEKEKSEKAVGEIRARDEFLSMASHEIKTPLTVMLLNIQKALHDIKNVSLADFSVADFMDKLQSVEHQTNRLAKMIKDLSNVSLITTGRLKLELEKGDLSSIVREVVKRLPSTLGSEDNYKINLEAKKPVLGMWDSVRVEQVVINLISNAVKYGKGKPVEVTVKQSGKTAKIIVKDSGIGIPKKFQKSIFERFERGTAGNSYQGLGVGLYITNQIVTAHGGKIKLDSKENRGSTFTIELPILKS